MPAFLHIAGKGFNDARRVNAALGQSNRPVEKIASLATLVERTKFYAQEFVSRVDGNTGIGIETSRCHRERLLLEAVGGEMLARVDLNFLRPAGALAF